MYGKLLYLSRGSNKYIMVYAKHDNKQFITQVDQYQLYLFLGLLRLILLTPIKKLSTILTFLCFVISIKLY